MSAGRHGQCTKHIMECEQAKAVIIGGGYIALELGQMFSRFGARVTIVERGDRLLSGYEPEISESIAEVLRAALAVKSSQIQLLSGFTSRQKRFLIRGCSKPNLEARLSTLLQYDQT